MKSTKNGQNVFIYMARNVHFWSPCSKVGIADDVLKIIIIVLVLFADHYTTRPKANNNLHIKQQQHRVYNINVHPVFQDEVGGGITFKYGTWRTRTSV